MENNNIIDEIIGKEFPQNCGDILIPIKKIKVGTRYKYQCKFIKYPYIGKFYKDNFVKGNCNNPQIEIQELIGKEFPQNCGDILKVIKKSNIKDPKNNAFYWECEFIKYPYTILCHKRDFMQGIINNPQIEQVEFVQKLWKQNCGDTLKIIEKTQYKDSQNHHYLWRAQFIDLPYEGLFLKDSIINGQVNNPLIEQEGFIKKEWKQNCGDTLKIIEKSNIKKGTEYLWKCEFIKYPCIVYCSKRKIILGNIENPNFPWNSKENLLNFINSNFDKKPTLRELQEKLKEYNKNVGITFAISTIGQMICRYELQNEIFYYPEGSKQEHLIRDYIQSLLPNEEITNSWDILGNGQEIDIYIPSLRLGFEFNGNYWHSSLFKTTIYHQEKSLLAQKNNISLFHIFEYDWNKNEEVIKSLIRSKLGIFSHKIGASKCKIKEVDKDIYKQFCTENHLQGECSAKVRLGLYYQDELVQVMSFDSPRFDAYCEWEIIRECSKIDWIIIGGKDKLWSYFCKNYLPKSVISYCDFGKFSGASYERLGFQKVRLNKPGFVWFDEETNLTLPRSPHKHNEYKEKYTQIWDCGQLVFVWEKKV